MMSADVFRFSCQCGAVLSARLALVGKKGKCAACKEVLVIPDPATVKVSATAEAIAVQEMCSVCQTAIDEDDERMACQVCDVPYHVECWEENLGCAVYGCRNVNVLKLGPDISIAAPPIVAPPATRAVAPIIAPEACFPWDYLWMGASAIAAPLGLLLGGIPSLLTGVAAISAFALSPEKSRWGPTITTLILSLIGGFVGVAHSYIFWTTRTF